MKSKACSNRWIVNNRSWRLRKENMPRTQLRLEGGHLKFMFTLCVCVCVCMLCVYVCQQYYLEDADRKHADDAAMIRR
jgi:hypothetical protein